MAAMKRALTPLLAWLALALCLATALFCALRLQTATAHNRMMVDGSLLKRVSLPDSPRLHYAAGWWYERAQLPRQALTYYAQADAAADPALAARARFALGNLYFARGLRAADIASGGSHVLALAQLQLAREAYRATLQLDPQLREARYNLELLERLSPERRVQGWSRRESRLQLDEAEQHGWAGMQETPMRGLP